MAPAGSCPGRRTTRPAFTCLPINRKPWSDSSRHLLRPPSLPDKPQDVLLTFSAPPREPKKLTWTRDPLKVGFCPCLLALQEVGCRARPFLLARTSRRFKVRGPAYAYRFASRAKDCLLRANGWHPACLGEDSLVGGLVCSYDLDRQVPRGGTTPRPCGSAIPAAPVGECLAGQLSFKIRSLSPTLEWKEARGYFCRGEIIPTNQGSES